MLLLFLLLQLYLHFSSLICRGNDSDWKILFHVACRMWAAAARLTCCLCHPCCRCCCCRVCCSCCCACQRLSSQLGPRFAGQVVSDCLYLFPILSLPHSCFSSHREAWRVLVLHKIHLLDLLPSLSLLLLLLLSYWLSILMSKLNESLPRFHCIALAKPLIRLQHKRRNCSGANCAACITNGSKVRSILLTEHWENQLKIFEKKNHSARVINSKKAQINQIKYHSLSTVFFIRFLRKGWTDLLCNSGSMSARSTYIFYNPKLSEKQMIKRLQVYSKLTRNSCFILKYFVKELNKLNKVT